jgi:hypothetical protein
VNRRRDATPVILAAIAAAALLACCAIAESHCQRAPANRPAVHVPGDQADPWPGVSSVRASGTSRAPSVSAWNESEIEVRRGRGAGSRGRTFHAAEQHSRGATGTTLLLPLFPAALMSGHCRGAALLSAEVRR